MSTEIATQNYINSQLTKFNVTDQTLANLKDQYMPLTIANLEDKDGYKAVKEARLKIKKYRVELDKKKKELKEEAMTYNRAIDKRANEIRVQLEEIEDHLEKQEKHFEAEKERIKLEKEKAEKERIAQRAKQLVDLGFIFNGYEYIGDFTIPGEEQSDLEVTKVNLNPNDLKSFSDSDFNLLYEHCKAKQEIKQSWLAEEKRKQAEAQAKLDAERTAELKRLQELEEKQKAEQIRLDNIAKEQAEKARLLEEERKAFEAEKLARDQKPLEQETNTSEQNEIRNNLDVISHDEIDKSTIAETTHNEEKIFSHKVGSEKLEAVVNVHIAFNLIEFPPGEGLELSNKIKTNINELSAWIHQNTQSHYI